MSNAAATSQRSTLDITGALKSAGLSALIAFGLFSLLIGVRTDQGPTGALVVHERLEALVVIVGVVFVGGLLRALIFGNEPIDFGRYVPASAIR